MTAAVVPAGAPRSLGGSPRRQRKERAIRYVFTGAALLSIVISVFIVLTLIEKAFGFVVAVDLGSLWSIGWFPRRGLFDLLTLFVGTLEVATIAMLIAVPVGLGAAIYLSEYASPFARKIIKPVVEILAGIPSVVLGFFALTFISPSIIQNLVPGAAGFNLAAAGVAVGILTVPLIASVSEDALRAVPRSLREASYGLGARRKTTTLRVVFPAAVSGTVAAIILGFSRAIGETMVVAVAAGASGGSLRSFDPFQPGQTMTAAMAALATGSDQVAGASEAFNSLFFIGFLLFAITLILNVVGDIFVRRTRQRY
jgi:phosphate transport system permease protein